MLGIQPYFDEPFHVGFEVGGFELGLNPNTPCGHTGPRAYWGVAHADAAYKRLLELGASELEPVSDVGGGVRIGAVLDPFSNSLGIVENPHFSFKKS